ncbi:hypothetical protein MSIMFB_01950 [Mycobacterium simulans]|uniref:Transmembrane protein n=2 Tax=Mycobacterium simulans TaxID=627089 RepID=A0A7Z7IKS1_9MYCO|nr:hypothetical protein MSIMFB_01950 [Mycobacterium simulans]
MSDLPPGEWSSILVGLYWPAGSNVATISAESTNFGTIAAGYRYFENQLQAARIGPLASQEGLTADDLRDTLRRGEENAHDVAEKNVVKKSAYDFVRDSANDLRSELTVIAREGNSKIKEIQGSKDSLLTKIDKITDVVLDCQRRANAKAAMCGDNILNATQNILRREGIDISARQFANDRAIDTVQMFKSPSKEAIHDQVKGILANPTPEGYKADVTGSPQGLESTGGGSPQTGPPGASAPASAPAPSPRPGKLDATPPQTGPPGASAPASAPAPSPRPGKLDATPPQTGPARPSAPTVGPVPLAGTVPPPVQAPSLPNATAVPTPTTMSPTGLPTGLTPSGLMQSFDHGLQAGAPISEAANTLSSAPMNAIDSHLPPPPVTSEAPAGSTIPATAHAPMVDTSEQAHPPVANTTPAVNAPTSDAGVTYVAAPPATAQPAPVGPPPSGPLTAYGADLRLTTTAASAPTMPSSPPVAAPGSAPVSPSSGAGGVGQPAVVRQPTAPTTAQQTPAGVVERAVAAAGGGVAGATSARATAQKRLQHIVDAVARQEPRLRWAAGDRPDGTTVLVTDLASGWIPPGIEIPVGVQLRDPAHRQNNIEALLGEVTATASYAPIHYVPPPDDNEPLATSSRARQVPAVDDLGWKLSQATNWRDGLPQLAHALAKAASRDTGVLDSEIEFLREELATVGKRVLDAYPNSVEPAVVANWQLLAAIDALAESDKTGAHYHFAWFQALGQAAAGGRTS